MRCKQLSAEVCPHLGMFWGHTLRLQRFREKKIHCQENQQESFIPINFPRKASLFLYSVHFFEKLQGVKKRLFRYFKCNKSVESLSECEWNFFPHFWHLGIFLTLLRKAVFWRSTPGMIFLSKSENENSLTFQQWNLPFSGDAAFY